MSEILSTSEHCHEVPSPQQWGRPAHAHTWRGGCPASTLCLASILQGKQQRRRGLGSALPSPGELPPGLSHNVGLGKGKRFLTKYLKQMQVKPADGTDDPGSLTPTDGWLRSGHREQNSCFLNHNPCTEHRILF